MDTVSLTQICDGHSVTDTDLWWTQCHWHSFVMDTVSLTQICDGHSVTDTVLWWTQFHWHRFVMDTVSLTRISLQRLRVFPVSMFPPFLCKQLPLWPCRLVSAITQGRSITLHT